MSADNVIDLTAQESVSAAAVAPVPAPSTTPALDAPVAAPTFSASAAAAAQAQEQEPEVPRGIKRPSPFRLLRTCSSAPAVMSLAGAVAPQNPESPAPGRDLVEGDALPPSGTVDQHVAPFPAKKPRREVVLEVEEMEVASPPIRARLEVLNLEDTPSEDEYGHCGSACSGRVVALIGNSNVAKAMLVNAWLGLGLLNPRSWFRCNYTFVHDEKCGDGAIAYEQNHSSGTFRTLRFANVAELAGYLHNKDLGDPAFNIRVHLRFSSNTPAAAAAAAQAQDPVQVNGVIFFHSMHSSAHTMARLISHANAIVWCNEAPLCVGDVLDLARSIARCRPDLYCKCVVYQNDNCGGPIPNRHIRFSRESIVKHMQHVWQIFCEPCGTGFITDPRWSLCSGMSWDGNEQEAIEFCAAGHLCVVCNGESLATPSILLRLAIASMRHDMFMPQWAGDRNAADALRYVASSPRSAAYVFAGAIGTCAADIAYPMLVQLASTGDIDRLGTDITPVLVRAAHCACDHALLQLWSSLKVGASDISLWNPLVDGAPLQGVAPLQDNGFAAVAHGLYARATSEEQVHAAADMLCMLPRIIHDALAISVSRWPRCDLPLGPAAEPASAAEVADAQAHTLRRLHFAYAQLSEVIIHQLRL